MKRYVLLLIAGAGCAAEPAQPAGGDDAPAYGDLPPITAQLTPTDCAQSLSLYGMTGSATPTVVPLSLSTAGVTLCLALDGRDNIQVAHFAANSPYEMADTSSYVFALFDANGTLITDGWDVAFGATPTTVFANLEAGMPKGQITNVRLVAATRTGERATEVYLHLFEPYE